jgi:hypothetical protein
VEHDLFGKPGSTFPDHALVDLADVNRTKTSSSRCSTAEGDVLVKVEQFAFTANNMTYPLIGTSTGWYWVFFQHPGDGPDWGLAKSSPRKSTMWKLAKTYSNHWIAANRTPVDGCRFLESFGDVADRSVTGTGLEIEHDRDCHKVEREHVAACEFTDGFLDFFGFLYFCCLMFPS